MFSFAFFEGKLLFFFLRSAKSLDLWTNNVYYSGRETCEKSDRRFRGAVHLSPRTRPHPAALVKCPSGRRLKRSAAATFLALVAEANNRSLRRRPKSPAHDRPRPYTVFFLNIVVRIIFYIYHHLTSIYTLYHSIMPTIRLVYKTTAFQPLINYIYICINVMSTFSTLNL